MLLWSVGGFVSLLKHVRILVKEHRDYFSLTFVIQRRQVWWQVETPHGYQHLRHPETASPMTREDTSWLSAPFVNQRKTSPLIETLLVSPLSTRDGKSDDTRKHLMVICTFFQLEASKPIDETPLVSPLSSRDDKYDDMRRHLLVSHLSSRDGKYDDMRRHLMVICTFCQLEASEHVDRDSFSLSFVIQRQQVRWHAETLYGYPHPSQPEASEPVDTQRSTWSSAPIVEDSTSVDWDYFSLTSVIQRQASPMTRGDKL